jgi:3-hydroxymyristoyl/3-hydroxydecanoyl-(acyl carrier protein) dehydratase
MWGEGAIVTLFEQAWRVPADHPAFAGHFPGHPIVPGVVLLDRAVQMAQRLRGGPLAGWQVTQVKFLSPCGPDDELVFALRDGARGGLAFSVHCGDREVASGGLLPPAP